MVSLTDFSPCSDGADPNGLRGVPELDLVAPHAEVGLVVWVVELVTHNAMRLLIQTWWNQDVMSERDELMVEVFDVELQKRLLIIELKG